MSCQEAGIKRTRGRLLLFLKRSTPLGSINSRKPCSEFLGSGNSIKGFLKVASKDVNFFSSTLFVKCILRSLGFSVKLSRLTIFLVNFSSPHPLEKRVSKPKVIEEKDFTNPFEYVTIYKWKYEFNKDE